jgi:DNA-binding transcriptional LysR family regulator
VYALSFQRGNGTMQANDHGSSEMKHPEYEWDDLRYFLALYRAKSISGAGRALGVDHATVSRRLKRLERSLNAKLLERTPSGYELTLAGGKILDAAETVESSLLMCASEITDRDMSLDGIVKVGAPDGFGSVFLAPRLAELCNRHPSLEVQLIATARLFSLSKREADISITIDKPSSGRIVSRKLTDYRLRMYAHADYLQRRGTPKTIDDLKEHEFIGYIENLLFSPMLDYIPLVSKQIQARFTSANLLAQHAAVAAGRGIGILPDFMITQSADLSVVLPSFHIDRTFYLLVHEDNRNLARIREVASFIADEVKRNQALFNRG